MKKLAKILTLVLVLCTVFATFSTSCLGNTPDTEGTVTVVVGKENSFTEYRVNLADVNITEGVFSILKHLNENEGLELQYQDSAYGAYLTSAANMEYDAMAGEYVTVLTSVESDFDTSLMFFKKDYKGVELGSSGLGVSTMKVEDGATYMVTIATFEF